MSTLFVDRRGVELEFESGAIVFRENGERIGTVPVAPLSRVFLRGDVRLSAALLGKLGEAGVGVVILSGRQGKPSLLLARPHNDAARRVDQIRRSLNPEASLAIAKELIERKLARSVEWFHAIREEKLHARYELTRAAGFLTDHSTRIAACPSAASLRGLEGAAAACYFQGLAALVPPSLKFSTRNRRPPRDPFNAVLSLTYTMLHAELAIALYGAGFDPFVGFYHCLDFGRESLASDLMEPLRPVADQFALRLFSKQTLTAEDFSNSESGCMLGKAGRARYYTAYEEASENLRTAINEEVERLSEIVGVPCAKAEVPDDSPDSDA